MVTINKEEAREKTRQRIIKAIGESWLRDVTDEELDAFAKYSYRSVIYAYAGNEAEQGHCFRGWKRGMEFARSQQDA